MVGSVRRRKYRAGERRRFQMGRCRSGQRHAHPGAADPRYCTAGKTTVLGGASVSGAPELYPEYDYLHIGEIGDATDRLIACLDNSVAPAPAQTRFETTE